MEFVTIKKISSFLKIKESTLYSWVHNGTIPCYKLNGLLRFDMTEIKEWIKESRLKPRNVTQKHPRKPKYDNDIDSTIRKAIDGTLRKSYTKRNEKTDRGQGSNLEVKNGTI